MGYLEETLTSGEVVLYRTGLHWTVLLEALVASVIFELAAIALFVAASRGASLGPPQTLVVLGVSCVVIGSVIYVVGLLRKSSVEMAVTNRRVLIKSGIFARNTLELVLSKIESIGVEQGIGGRMAGYGRVVIRGTGGTHEVFDRIARPLDFRRQVQEQIHQLQGPHERPATRA